MSDSKTKKDWRLISMRSSRKFECLRTEIWEDSEGRFGLVLFPDCSNSRAELYWHFQSKICTFESIEVRSHLHLLYFWDWRKLKSWIHLEWLSHLSSKRMYHVTSFSLSKPLIQLNYQCHNCHSSFLRQFSVQKCLLIFFYHRWQLLIANWAFSGKSANRILENWISNEFSM